jgi:hypothetical protein
MAVNQLIATNLAAIATFENERRKETDSAKEYKLLRKMEDMQEEKL